MNPAPAPPWHGMILQDIGGGRKEGKGGDGETSNLVQYPSPPPLRAQGRPEQDRKGGLEIPPPLLSPLPICAIASTFPHLAKEEEKNRERGGDFHLLPIWVGKGRSNRKYNIFKGLEKRCFRISEKQRYQIYDFDGGDGGGQKYFFVKNMCCTS